MPDGVIQVERTGEGATFDDLLLLYLEQVTPTKRAPERDKWSAKELQPIFSGRRLDSIGSVDVRAYIAMRTAAGIAPWTLNKEIGLLSAALNWARKALEWEVANPCESCRLTEPAGRDRWLTPEEAARLIAVAERRKPRYPWLVDFIRLGLNTGMRLGEMLELEWSRVDLKAGRVLFKAGTDQKNGKAGMIPLNQKARDTLLTRARFRASHCPRSAPDLRVLVGPGGNWHRAERVLQLLRHGDVAITSRVYAHLRPDDLADAVAILDGPEITGRVAHCHAAFHVGSDEPRRVKKPAETG